MTERNEGEPGRSALDEMLAAGDRPRRRRRPRLAVWLPAWRGPLLRTRRERLLAGTGAVVVAAALVIGGALIYLTGHQGKQVTAYFTETIGIYPGSDVRVLGVKIGTVDAVRPRGSQVQVTMTLDHAAEVPASARAVVIAPSVVADRYIQLTPAYTGGPRLVSGAVIPASRTAVPAEVDQVYASLQKLATALGPAGANSRGALSSLIKTGAANLSGNGTALHNMLNEYSGLTKTLGGSASNLAATIAYLQQFTTTLKDSNGQVRQAEQQLADVSGFLAGDRQQLAAALHDLSVALGQVQSFIGSNRALIKSNVTKLATITQLLVNERASLAEALDTAPLAADNLLNAYDAAHRTLDGRGDLNEFSMGPAGRGLTAATSPQGAAPTGAVPVTLAELAKLPPLPLPAVGPAYGTPQAILAGGH
jgi:phospholipid/cholesterol/gamma-HCH transport system substrate-binding protein